MNGEKPVVAEVGPYAFNEYFTKFDIEFTDGGDTVTYNIYRYYVFDQARTGPGLTQFDNITLPYPSALGFQYLLGTIPYEKSLLLDYLLIVSQLCYFLFHQ